MIKLAYFDNESDSYFSLDHKYSTALDLISTARSYNAPIKNCYYAWHHINPLKILFNQRHDDIPLRFRIDNVIDEVITQTRTFCIFPPPNSL